MPRTLTLALLVLTGIGWAATANAQPFFIAYLAPSGATTCDLSATDPANFQGGNPAAEPVLPGVLLPVGQTLTYELCFIVWPVVDSLGTEAVCLNGSGTDSCAEQLAFTSNAGIAVTGFTAVPPESGPPPNFPKYQSRSTPSSLFIAGGHPTMGRQGNGLQGLHLGTLTLQGVGPGGTFQLTGQGGYVDAAMQRQPLPNIVLAATEDNCGDNVLDPGEECDDGDESFGDGCAPTCRLEAGFTLEGAVGPSGTTGSLSVEIDGVGVTLDLSSLPNAPADEVLLALVTSVNDEPSIGASAAQADDPNHPPPDDGRAFVTDGDLTNDPILVVSQGSLQVPEPGHFVLLGAGIAFLATVGRRRIQPRG